MTPYQDPLTRLTLLENLRRLGVCYEIYPDLAALPDDAPVNWFEIALHVELAEFRSPEHPESREAFAVLMDLADFLIQRIRVHAPYNLELSDSFHLLPEAPAQPRLARTVSLIFPNAGFFTRREEPAILTQLRAELRQLEIPRLARAASGEGR